MTTQYMHNKQATVMIIKLNLLHVEPFQWQPNGPCICQLIHQWVLPVFAAAAVVLAIGTGLYPHTLVRT